MAGATGLEPATFPVDSPGRSNQLKYVFPILLFLDHGLSLHRLASGAKNLLINEPPRCLVPGVGTSAFIMATKSFLQIGGITDVVATVLFAFQNVDNVRHLTSGIQNHAETVAHKATSDLLMKKGLAKLNPFFKLGGSDGA